MDRMDSKDTALMVAGTLAAAAGIYFAFRWRSRAKNSDPIIENSRITISDISIFPIKSCGGISLNIEEIGPFSLRRDRRWMLVREDTKRFISQRQYPKMSLITPSIDKSSDGFIINAPGMDERLLLPFKGIQPNGPRYDVGIWDDTCPAIDEGDAAAAWFSKYLNVQVRLVRTPDDMQRFVPEKYRAAGADNIASYADGFPFLLISEASLEELNQMIGVQEDQKMIMRRFRPNIVVRGATAFEEDSWKTIQIGSVVLHNVKPCSRCKLTTVVPQLGEFGGPEPLQTIQKSLKGFFGQNLTHSTSSIGKSIRVGQGITVLETKPTEAPADEE